MKNFYIGHLSPNLGEMMEMKYETSFYHEPTQVKYDDSPLSPRCKNAPKPS